MNSESVDTTKLLKELRAAFLRLPPSVPLVSNNEALDGEYITNTGSDAHVEYHNFNHSLRQIFGDLETGLIFPERGQRLNDLVEDFEVMIDIIARGPDSVHHLLDEVLFWAQTLIMAAKDLRHKHDVTMSTHNSGELRSMFTQLVFEETIDIPLRLAAEIPLQSDNHALSTPPTQYHPPMNRMRPGTLPFRKIGAEEAASQSRREFAIARKDTKEQKRKDRKAKERKQDEKRAAAVRRQRECRERKKSRDIQSGLRNPAGKKVRKTVNDAVNAFPRY